MYVLEILISVRSAVLQYSSSVNECEQNEHDGRPVSRRGRRLGDAAADGLPGGRGATGSQTGEQRRLRRRERAAAGTRQFRLDRQPAEAGRARHSRMSLTPHSSLITPPLPLSLPRPSCLFDLNTRYSSLQTT